MIKKIDPRTKLFLLIVINIIMMGGKISGTFTFFRIIIAMIPFLLMVNEKWYRKAAMYFVLYAYSFSMERYILTNIQTTLLIIILFTTGMISRFLASAMMAYYLMKTTTVSEFVTAMEKMHIPMVIVIPFAVMFRFFPTIKEEWHDIRFAMKMRGILTLKRNPFDTLEYALVPLFMSISKIAEELSAASMAKCLTVKGKRTHIVEIGFSFFDFLLFSIGIFELGIFSFFGGIVA